MQKKIDNPFELEKIRARLAFQSKYNELIKTYSLKNQEIEDKNTPYFWDDMNLRKHISKGTNPMAYDRVKIVSRLLKRETKVLNIGVGVGDLENMVLRKFGNNFQWYGIDISPQTIRRLKKEFQQANFKIGDIRKIKYEDNFFDYVILMEILEHIKPSEILKALKEVNRVLKEKGNLIVSVPLNEGIEQMVKEGRNPNAHLRNYTPELILAELKISRFEIIYKKYLYAFHRYYFLKSFITNYLLPGFIKPNNLILYCVKL